MMKRNEILLAGKNNIFILIFLLFTGCNLKQNNLEINHYGMDFKIEKRLEKSKLEAIFIEDINVNKSFNHTSIFYNTKPYLFEEYAKNRWINLPSNMIYNQLIDSFITSNVFENVISKDVKIEHKYSLKTDIIKLYQEFEEKKSYSILRVKFDLIENEKVVKSFSYDKKILCKTNDAYGFVEALNKGFEEVVNDLLNNFASL